MHNYVCIILSCCYGDIRVLMVACVMVTLGPGAATVLANTVILYRAPSFREPNVTYGRITMVTDHTSSL